MNYAPGEEVPVNGVYWCTVCKLPAKFTQGEKFPGCKNLCGRGRWHLVKASDAPGSGEK